MFNSKGRAGKVASFVIGDETGTIRIVMWGEQAENIAKLKENMIVKVLSGYVRENQNGKEVHLNDSMVPGVVDADSSVKKNDLVWIRDEKH
ncbi:MAG: hypothetical protein KKD12_01890, partial [Proteobacteria bacterium]|nr:hypothetical protein [Pseudomonadota bacterium]